MRCSPAATVTSNVPAFQGSMPPPITKNGLTITWNNYVTIGGIPMVSGALSWSPVSSVIAFGQQVPVVDYCVTTLTQKQIGNSVIYGESPFEFTAPQGTSLHFTVSACWEPDTDTACPLLIGTILVTTPKQS